MWPQDDSPPDQCGGEDLEPKRPNNRPGLSAIDYRIGRHADFLKRMLWGIPRVSIPGLESESTEYPLRNLTERRPDDPSISLMDAWASTLDVLAFYQERIANEGYLRTAKERMSALEMARTIGYELDPGVAASTYLAFTVEDADDPFRLVDVPVGTQVMSVPQEKGELPQIFETTQAIEARAEWNEIPAQTERPQNLVLYQDEANGNAAKNGTLYLVDTDNSVDFDTMIEMGLIEKDDVEVIDRAHISLFFPITPGLDLKQTLDDLEEDSKLNPEINPVIQGIAIDHVQIRGTGMGLNPGDRLIAVGVRTAEIEGESAYVAVSPFRIAGITADADYNLTRIDLVSLGTPPALRRIVKFVFRPPKLRIGTVVANRVTFNERNVASHVRRSSWTGPILGAFLKTQRWPRIKVMQLIRQAPQIKPRETSDATLGLYILRQRVGFFGNTAPKWESLADPKESRGTAKKVDDPFAVPWEPARVPRPIWVDSQGQATFENADAYLEREIEEVVPDSWALLETPAGKTKILRVADAVVESRSDFAISGKSTGLKFREPDGIDFSPFDNGGVKDNLKVFNFRTATAHVASEPINLAGLPIREELAGGSEELTLDSLYLDLEVGRSITLSGERGDAPGVMASESIILKQVSHSGGHTRLRFKSGIEFAYRRTTVRVNANVSIATHGEAIEEALGSGDVTVPNQVFALAKTPLTFTAADSETGSASTLVIRVNGVKWSELGSLYDADHDDEVFMTRIDDGGKTRVIFGDGIHGKRLPTGINNVVATYRAGMGPEGEVAEETLIQLKTRPLGIRSVTNASPASGAAPATTLEEARTRAADSVRTLGRIVSFIDYQNFANSFAGIGKAFAEQLWWRDKAVIHVTIAPVSNSALEHNAPTLSKLKRNMEKFRDPILPLIISPHETRFFTLAAKITCDARYVADDVEAAVRSALETAFGYNTRTIGQAVSSAEVIAEIQSVDGVVFVDLDALQLYQVDTASAQPPVASVLVAHTARVSADEREIIGAELLTVLSAGVDLIMEVADAQT
jgi:hypothetical protein